MKGIFVTGTDTGIGKTLVSAWLAKAWGADYWKPVQTGAPDDCDSATVAALAGVATHPSAYRLKAPRSPHDAALAERTAITLDAFRLPSSPRAIVVEGAGGVLVPLNDDTLMVDLIRLLGLPVLIVARSGMGTVNHTLMTIEALRRRDAVIRGVVMNGPPDAANRAAIEAFGHVSVVAELPWLDAGASLDALPTAPDLGALTA